MRLVILDRDGVINQDSDDFIKSPEEWIPIPGSLEAIARLCRAEFRIVIITNQSGIARGKLTIDTLNRIHTRMLEHIHQKGGEIDAIMICPHGPDDNCECRKPKPGMFLELAQRLKINLSGVPAVGDSVRDVEAARAAKALPVLVRTGKGMRNAKLLSASEDFDDVPVFEDLAAFANDLLRNTRQV
ncbi:MAG: D-glycero-beta-D-manno-heptose 1,7-bisphosphate 7-phosphatase [Arenicellales bacterium]|nr:D-glycero-beta-D-manno-heptose 1,7-bisphosphate 7-phosphatase [Arenicellales bacterium]